MKILSHSSRQSRQRGSTLVLSIMICGLGTLGVVATASILQARGMEAEQTQAYTERWTRLQNSKALARQVLYRKYTTSESGPSSSESYVLPDGWGEINVEGFDGPALSATSTRVNKTGAVSFNAFTQDVAVGIGDGTFLDEYQFQIKSSNPMLSGNLLVVQKPLIGTSVPEVIGNFRVKGRAFFSAITAEHDDDTIHSDEFLALGDGASQPALVDTSENASSPQNFSIATRTSSEIDGNAAFDGRVSVIENDETPHNAYLTRIQALGITTVFDGDLPYAKGVGVDTNPPGPDDASQIAQIREGGDWEAIRSSLNSSAPLSSDVLRAFFEVNPPSGILMDVLNANAPLPNDVLFLVADTTALNQGQKEQVLVDSPMIARSDGEGNVIILPVTNVATHIVVTNARSVVFQGSTDYDALLASESLNSLVVVIQQKDSDSNQLETIEFEEQNRRRLIIAVKRESVGDLAVPVSGGTAFPEWRMLMELESARTSFDVSPIGGLIIEGGIRTDQRLEATGGSVTLKREKDAGDLITLSSRDAWIEEFRN